MPWVELGSTDIRYYEEGAGQSIVFLHGASSCGEAWFQQFDRFRDRYRVIAYDSVNHGHSSNSPRDEEEPDRADELESFLAALRIERPILVGNSMGANTLLRWAARHPGDARALIASGMGVPPEGEASTPRTATPLDSDTLFLPIGDSLTDKLRREQPRHYERYLRIRSTATRIEALRHPRRPSSRTSQERADLGARVARIASPMQIIVGSLDRLLPWAERLHELVPGSRYRVIQGAPHNVYYEAADEYNELVEAFLSEVLAPV